MNACLPLGYRRQRADALHLGPSDDAVAAILAELKADDSEVVDAASCFERAEEDELDTLRLGAYRTGDWAAYGARYTQLITDVLTERAWQRARSEQEASWNDMGDD